MDIEIHKNNLKKYIEEDMTFKGPLKNISDFDKYCYNHCLDIKEVLSELEKKDKIIDKIYDFCRRELAFEKRLKREKRKPDEFNQGRFYVCENIKAIITNKAEEDIKE